MKFSTTIFTASIATSVAFSPQTQTRSGTIRLQNIDDDTVPDTSSPEMSKSLPFQRRPHMLDGTLAGDVGFDPFGFAGTEENLLAYREAEIKHARLAMLAAAGRYSKHSIRAVQTIVANLDHICFLQDGRLPNCLIAKLPTSSTRM